MLRSQAPCAQCHGKCWGLTAPPHRPQSGLGGAWPSANIQPPTSNNQQPTANSQTSPCAGRSVFDGDQTPCGRKNSQKRLYSAILGQSSRQAGKHPPACHAARCTVVQCDASPPRRPCLSGIDCGAEWGSRQSERTPHPPATATVAKQKK